MFSPALRASLDLRSPMLRSLRSPVLTGDDYLLDSQFANDPSEIIEIIHETERSRFKMGILLIIVALVTWMVGLELVNTVLKDDSYQKPFLFAYITGGFFSLNLLADVKYLFVKRQPGEKLENEPIALTRYEVVLLSLQITIIYYVYNAAVMSALKYTSASNQTVLSSTTTIFTLFIGSFLQIDSLSTRKVLCAFVSFCGVLLINFSDGKAVSDGDNKFIPKDPKLGNSLAILGALMYAFYLIIMSVRLGTKRTTNETRLFGLVGLFTLILGIPVLYVVHITGIEPFQFPPPDSTTLAVILINGLFSYISDFTTILALMLTSPLITSLSLTSSVPVTITCDMLILHFTGGSQSKLASTKLMYALGIISILTSVVLINLTSSAEDEYIEQVIDNTLQQNIEFDEVLSPMLSPMLDARTTAGRKQTRKKVSHLSLAEGERELLNSRPQSHTEDEADLVVYGGKNHMYYIKPASET